jgi:hypothetical protein
MKPRAKFAPTSLTSGPPSTPREATAVSRTASSQRRSAMATRASAVARAGPSCLRSPASVTSASYRASHRFASDASPAKA